MTTTELIHALWLLDHEERVFLEQLSKRRAELRQRCTHRDGKGERDIQTDSVEARHFCAACGLESPP